MPAGERTMREAAARWYTHLRLPSVASKAKIRLSAVRASTSPPATRGAASTSDETRARQRGVPLSASSTISSPLSVPTATSLPSVPTPPESGEPADTFQIGLPVAASSLVTVPSRAAAYTLSPARAGVNTKMPAGPTLACQIVFTGCAEDIGGSSAGFTPVGAPLNQSMGLRLGMLEQLVRDAAAKAARIARTLNPRARRGASGCCRAARGFLDPLSGARTCTPTAHRPPGPSPPGYRPATPRIAPRKPRRASRRAA